MYGAFVNFFSFHFLIPLCWNLFFFLFFWYKKNHRGNKFEIYLAIEELLWDMVGAGEGPRLSETGVIKSSKLARNSPPSKAGYTQPNVTFDGFFCSFYFSLKNRIPRHGPYLVVDYRKLHSSLNSVQDYTWHAPHFFHIWRVQVCICLSVKGFALVPFGLFKLESSDCNCKQTVMMDLGLSTSARPHSNHWAKSNFSGCD